MVNSGLKGLTTKCDCDFIFQMPVILTHVVMEASVGTEKMTNMNAHVLMDLREIAVKSVSGHTQQTQNILYNICTKLDQRRRRWADVVQMLYKYFVFVGS